MNVQRNCIILLLVVCIFLTPQFSYAAKMCEGGGKCSYGTWPFIGECTLEPCQVCAPYGCTSDLIAASAACLGRICGYNPSTHTLKRCVQNVAWLECKDTGGGPGNCVRPNYMWCRGKCTNNCHECTLDEIAAELSARGISWSIPSIENLWTPRAIPLSLIHI